MLLADGVFEESDGGGEHDVVFQFVQDDEKEGVEERWGWSHISALFDRVIDRYLALIQ
jgi:hypothetical protein